MHQQIDLDLYNIMIIITVVLQKIMVCEMEGIIIMFIYWMTAKQRRITSM